MSRPGCGCCDGCACIYKVDKNTGTILWAKNLGFDATAITTYKDRIYVAIKNIGIDNQNGDDGFPIGPSYYSLYDIIVLDKAGQIIEKECLTFLPKTTVPDAHGYDKTDKNVDSYKEIIDNSGYDIIENIYVCEDDDNNLYVNVIITNSILQIKNGVLSKIIALQSSDRYLDGKYLVQSCNEVPYYNKFYMYVTTSINYDLFKYEIGDDYIKVSKYLTLDDELKDVKMSDYKDMYLSHFMMLRYIKLNDTYRYDSLGTILSLNKNAIECKVETDVKENYILFRFNMNIRNIVFVRIERIDFASGGNIGQAKQFNSTCSVTTNGYHNMGALTHLPKTFSDIQLEEHAKILFGAELPKSPKLYRAKLDLIDYIYYYEEYNPSNDIDDIISMIDINEIEGRLVDLQIACLPKYPGRKTSYGKVDYKIMEYLENVDIANNIFFPGSMSNSRLLYLFDDNLVYNDNLAYAAREHSVLRVKDNPGQLIQKERPLPVILNDVIITKPYKIKVDNKINCGYMEELTTLVKSYQLKRVTVSSSSPVTGVEGHIESQNFEDNLYRLGKTVREVIDEAGDIAKCKLAGINFQQISRSYTDFDGNKVYNAIMVGNWAIYQNIYSSDTEISAGKDIEVFGYHSFFYALNTEEGDLYIPVDAFVALDKDNVQTIVLNDENRYQWYWDNNILPRFYYINKPPGFPAGYYNDPIAPIHYFTGPTDPAFIYFVDIRWNQDALTFVGETEKFLTSYISYNATLNIYGNKLAPYAYIHTNTKVVIRLNEKTGVYTIEKNDKIDHSLYDYNHFLHDSNDVTRMSVASNYQHIRLDRFMGGDLDDTGSTKNPSLASQNLNELAYDKVWGPKSLNPSYGLAGPIKSGNYPKIVNNNWPDKYLYREYIYDVKNTLSIPSYAYTSGNAFKGFVNRSKFNKTLLNDTWVNNDYVSQGSRFITHDNDSEYITLASNDGRRLARFDTSSYYGGTNIDGITVLFYNYIYKATGPFTIGYYVDGTGYIYQDFSFESGMCSDVVNFINKNGGDVSPIEDTPLSGGYIAISNNTSLPTLGHLVVKTAPYEEEKYNIFKFTSGELKWKSNFLMQPRPYSDFANSGDANASTYNSYRIQDDIFPLDMCLDDDYLYISSEKRKNSYRSVDNNFLDATLSEQRLNQSLCGELTSPLFQPFIGYTMKELKDDE